MPEFSATRFRFIAEALEGTGGFRPAVGIDAKGNPSAPQHTYLVRYPRESEVKFARRNEVAWYQSHLASACERFASYLSARSASRDTFSPLYSAMADDINGCGDEIDVFWHSFAVQAKARGSMLLLVDAPSAIQETLADQIAQRTLPVWHPIPPEKIADYQMGDDGRFEWVSFSGRYVIPDGEEVAALWRFDRNGWQVKRGDDMLDGGEHGLGECPVLIFTESGEFPCYGSFAQIADLSRRLFNLTSELDEILRAQTFSLLTYQVPPESAHQFDAGAVSEAIGTHNMLVHNGQTPAFIAPPDGPARIYLDTIAAMERRINDIALAVEAPDQQESGIALQMRFQALNAALSTFSGGMQDLERRAWEISRRMLGLSVAPDIRWNRDFTLADINTELATLQQLQMANAPLGLIAEQMKRFVMLQYGGIEQDRAAELIAEIDEQDHERTPDTNHNQE
ncbi:MAG: hypothetical protein JNK52_13525 [Zoogloeaceae bacterium]|nr:hypothetical protein [Zoogloeaceae bacterium]